MWLVLIIFYLGLIVIDVLNLVKFYFVINIKDGLFLVLIWK